MTTEQTQIPARQGHPRTTGVGGYFELSPYLPLTPYLQVAQRQLETNLRMAATWAAAISAMSGSMLTQAQSTGRTTGDERADGMRQPNIATDRVFTPIGEDGHGAGSIPTATPYWLASGNATTSWPRWLNEPPTVQPDLFDEAIELLIDDDIKTAS